VPDYARVTELLRSLPEQWQTYSKPLRNRLLKTLIDHVELKGNDDIEATLFWKAGFRQQVIIHWKLSREIDENLWKEEETKLLRLLFPASSQKAVLAALPGRSWKSITLKAGSLHLKRKRGIASTLKRRLWTKDEDSRLKLGLEKGLTPTYLASELNRSLASVMNRINKKGLKQLPFTAIISDEVAWEVHNLTPHQEPCPCGISRRPWLSQSRILRKNKCRYI